MAIEFVVIPEEKESKFKHKVRQLKSGAREKVDKIKKWAREHPEYAYATAVTLVAGGAKITKTLYKNHHKKVVLDRVEDLKDRYVYDRSLGHYWKLRRVLTNQEWLELDRRRKQGERMADILASMDVLA